VIGTSFIHVLGITEYTNMTGFEDGTCVIGTSISFMFWYDMENINMIGLENGVNWDVLGRETR